jgi:hypothetical protein
VADEFAGQPATGPGDFGRRCAGSVSRRELVDRESEPALAIDLISLGGKLRKVHNSRRDNIDKIGDGRTKTRLPSAQSSQMHTKFD